MPEKPGERVPLCLRGEPSCIFGIERLGHIQPVQPYLVRIHGLVPEYPVSCTRLAVKLCAHLPEHTAVSLLPCHPVQAEEHPGRADMVHIEGRFLVLVHRAVLPGYCVGPFLNIFYGIVQVIALCHIHERQEFESGSIVPLQFPLTAVKICSLRIARHLREHHPYGDRSLAAAFRKCGSGHGRRGQESGGESGH